MGIPAANKSNPANVSSCDCDELCAEVAAGDYGPVPGPANDTYCITISKPGFVFTQKISIHGKGVGYCVWVGGPFVKRTHPRPGRRLQAVAPPPAPGGKQQQPGKQQQQPGKQQQHPGKQQQQPGKQQQQPGKQQQQPGKPQAAVTTVVPPRAPVVPVPAGACGPRWSVRCSGNNCCSDKGLCGAGKDHCNSKSQAAWNGPSAAAGVAAQTPTAGVAAKAPSAVAAKAASAVAAKAASAVAAKAASATAANAADNGTECVGELRYFYCNSGSICTDYMGIEAEDASGSAQDLVNSCDCDELCAEVAAGRHGPVPGPANDTYCITSKPGYKYYREVSIHGKGVGYCVWGGKRQPRKQPGRRPKPGRL